MNETAERKAEKEFVSVVCLGIACETGFALNPVGYEPSFANFKPGEPLKLEKHHVDFLMEQDPTRFQITETKLISQKEIGRIPVSTDKDGHKAPKKGPKKSAKPAEDAKK